jgi:hypothetical protein
MWKFKHFVSKVLHFQKSFLGGASKTRGSKTQHTPVQKPTFANIRNTSKLICEIAKSLRRYYKHKQKLVFRADCCICESGFVKALEKLNSHKCKTINTQHRLLLISAIPPGRFGDFANQLGGIAWICKSSDFASEVLRFQNSFFRGALKTRLSKMQYLWDEMLDISCFCNTSHTIWTILTCQALRRGPFPPPKW